VLETDSESYCGGGFAENGQQSNMWFICLEMVPLSPLKFALGLVYFDCSLPRSSEGIRGKGNKTKQNKTPGTKLFLTFCF
jgi:hypothetical protein